VWSKQYLPFRQIFLSTIDNPAIFCILYWSKLSGYAVRLSTTDRELIALLNQNARMTSAEISRQLGLAERTVRNRIARLINEGIIKLVAVVDPIDFGYDLIVDIFCEVEAPQRETVIGALTEIPEISYIAVSTGDQDLSLQALFKNSTDMNEFITTRLYQIPGIRRSRAVLVPRIVKDTHQWLPPVEDFSRD
jgi:Lrp/AsnC family transcriptional regulator for asnA, asnC and gidA